MSSAGAPRPQVLPADDQRDGGDVRTDAWRDPRKGGTDRGRRNFSSAAARADAAAKAKPAREMPTLEPGDRVLHDSFGMGTVVAVEGAADKAVASIDFGSEGVKRLLLRYAPVEKL